MRTNAPSACCQAGTSALPTPSAPYFATRGLEDGSRRGQYDIVGRRPQEIDGQARDPTAQFGQGVGVVKLPSMVADAYVASGRLVNATPGWSPPSGIVHAVFPTRRGLLPSVRGLIDHLAAQYAALKATEDRKVEPGDISDNGT